MRCYQKTWDARREGQARVIRAATRYLQGSGCGSSPPAPPARPSRCADAMSGGALASLATPQLVFSDAILFFLALLLGDDKPWAHRGVVRRLFGITKPRGLRLTLHHQGLLVAFEK